MDRWFASWPAANVSQASVRLEPDTDNVLRRWPRCRRLPPFLPLARDRREAPASLPGQHRFPRCRHNRERLVFNQLPIDLFADPGHAPPCWPSQVKGRIVLIGGDLPDVDQFEIPGDARVDRRSDDERTGSPRHHAGPTARPAACRAGSGRSALWALAILVVLSGAFTAMLDVRPVGRRAGRARPARLLRRRAPSVRMARHRHPWPARLRLARRLGAGLCATGAAVRAIGSDQRRLPSRRSANICRATSPRRSCAIPTSCR